MSAELRDRLRRALVEAMRARDRTATTALRAALGAVDNAEAVDAAAPATSELTAGPIAGAVDGLGGAEVDRRVLSEQDVVALVAAQAEERETTADEYDRMGQHDAAGRLRDEAAVLRHHLAR